MGPRVNPFWSDRLRDEVAVQQARPVDLPVPSGDEGDLEALTGEQPVPVKNQETELSVGSGDRAGKGEENGLVLQQVGEMKDFKGKVVVEQLVKKEGKELRV